MTNSEDTSTGDNLSTINNSASKVNDSVATGSSAPHHPTQLGGGSGSKETCGVADLSRVNGTSSSDVTAWLSNGAKLDNELEDSVYGIHTSHGAPSASSSCAPDAPGGSGGEALLSASNVPQLPFRLICGERLEYKCDTTEGVLALTNYRLFIKGKLINFNIPLGVIEQVENRDIFFLHVMGKDARCIRCTFPNNETATETMKRIQMAIGALKTMEDTFAYTFFVRSQEEANEEVRAQLGLDLPPFPTAKERFDMEIKRMEFNVQGPWRISDENKDYELCGSYPTHIIVPSSMTKKQLENVACFRSARRIPAVVWRHRGNGAVISRCSQPEVGWFGWRSAEDEELVQNIVMACADNSKMTTGGMEPMTKQPERIRMDSDSGDDTNSNDTHNGSLLSMELVPDPPNTKKLLIIDARSYTTAVANRARGGGCECLEYYPRCEIQFMNLANIHSIRKSFINVRQLCSMAADQSNWYSQLESCKWLQHMSGLMKAAVTVVTAIEEEGRPVMVHCSDGWDRTPQIVALSEILLDPYYRSLEGFQVLVEREWLDFGHKFADRCGQPLGSEDANERCPVFLQWLDCLHQLIRQFPSAFEFNLTFLVKLAQHTYSNLFGTFLCNTSKERQTVNLERLTHSVWRFLRAPANAAKFRNNLYLQCDKALWPSCEVRDLVLWSQVFLGYENPPSQATEILNPSQESSPAPSVAADCEMGDRMAACKGLNKSKTRSCEDLHAPSFTSLQRRQSDPNLSDSFHAGDACDDDDEEDDDDDYLDGNHSLRTSSPRKKPSDPSESSELINNSGYTADDSSTGIGRLTDFEDSENEDTEPKSESQSESTVVSVARVDPKSVESSTDTLVADMVAGVGSSPEGTTTILGGDGRRMLVPKTEATTTTTLRARGDGELVVGPGKTEYVHTPSNLGLADTTATTLAKRYPPHHHHHPRGGAIEQEITVARRNNPGNSSANTVPTAIATSAIAASSTGVDEFRGKVKGGGVDLLNAGDEGVLLDAPVHCEVCATSRRLLGDTLLSGSCVQGNNVTSTTTSTSAAFNNNVLTSGSVSASFTASATMAGSGDASKVSSYNTPMHSRTPSTGVPATPAEEQARGGGMITERQLMMQEMALGATNCAATSTLRSAFDVDGLSSLHDEVQNRLNTIVHGYKSQIEILQKELQMTRDALMKQVCHTCTHHVSERPDDVASVGDSLASGEHQSVGHESQSSEISWEAVDEKDTRPPLWLPDYAVTNCMGCEASFWLGRRKHHCRSCGKIFCADCSDLTITIPSEQLFTPVRVCTACFQRLANHSSENVPGPTGSSLPNGLVTSSTSEDLPLQPPLPPNNCSNGGGRHSQPNGSCDHSKQPGVHGCFSTSSSPPTASSAAVPSSSALREPLNHSSKTTATSNGLATSEPDHAARRQQHLPASSKLTRNANPTCKQQSTSSSSSSNDLQNHHATVTKGN